MANRYGGITGSKKISEDWNNINTAFDKVQADVDAKAATVITHIANADIHVTKADKTKWDGHVANADIHVTAAQKAAWDAKADGNTATELADHVADQVVHVTQDDHDKLDGIEEGAQVNQNAFAKVNDITAADPSSQFYIVGGIGITVTTNPINGEITVTATGDAAPGAHGSTHSEHGADPIPTATLTEGGLLSAAQLAEIVAHGELLDEHAAAITDLEDRLNDAETVTLTLQPGLQVINAAKDARFKLGEVRGRTLVNLLGKRGECEGTNPAYYLYNATLSVDAAVKYNGSASLKLASNTVAGAHYFRFMNNAQSRIAVTDDQCLLYGTWIKPLVNSGAQLALFFFDSAGNDISYVKSEILTDSSKFSFLKILAKVPATTTSVLLQVSITDASGNETFTGTGVEGLNLDSAYLYTITDAEYAALSGMTNDQIAVKYPFVSSGIVGVENPYAIATSGNMLPPFYEWDIIFPGLVSEYEGNPVSVGTQLSSRSGFIPALPNESYSLSVDTSGVESLGISFHDKNGDQLQTTGFVVTETLTATSPAGTALIRVHLQTPAAPGIYKFKNPMLVIGTEPKPFGPQHKSMLAFQTELHADPEDGSDPDVLFEQDGRYGKLEKWKKFVLDGTHTGPYDTAARTTDGRRVRIRYLPGAAPSHDTTGKSIVFGTKFDGKMLNSPLSENDAIAMGNQDGFGTYVIITVLNADSGWGEDYNPSEAEIRAYLKGWKMYTFGSGAASLYNGSGTRAWCYRADGITGNVDADFAGGTRDLPTTQAPKWSPYQLLYRLAKETIEPVTVEGCLTLTEGENVVEVGTGIVLREQANPKQEFTGPDIGKWFINSKTPGPWESTRFAYEARKIIGIYKDGMRDNSWVIQTSATAFGKELAYTVICDQSATYSVTYTKLDKSPVVPITGNLAANEKAQLSDLTAGVAEALHGVSVLQMQKAEKDAPSPQWITPTLLNGWVNFGAQAKAGYMKDSSGIVWIKGLVKGGVVSPAADAGNIFTLPIDYRPAEEISFTVRSDEVVGVIVVDANGRVRAFSGSNAFISLNGVQFPTTT